LHVRVWQNKPRRRGKISWNSQGTIYLYFDSKGEILEAISSGMFAHLSRILKRQDWKAGGRCENRKGWDEHATFMNALEVEHFVVLGGPLGNYPKHRALLIVSAPDDQVLRARLLEDPWMQMGILRTIEIYPWEILLGQLS
jgi:AcrR family transcriptional regulator